MNKICHCAHCLYENECADNNWSIYIDYDPCCPNMKEGRKQTMKDWEEYLEESIRIHNDIL